VGRVIMFVMGAFIVVTQSAKMGHMGAARNWPPDARWLPAGSAGVGGSGA